MRKKYIINGFICFLLITTSFSRAQDTKALVENLEVFTDRSMYAVGENICFSAVVLTSDNRMTGLSKVFYVELITPEGERIAGRKYPLTSSSGHGCLAIPSEVLTGTYYLKCYTRFMRNGPLSGYHFVQLKIINSDNPQVLSEGNHHDDGQKSSIIPIKKAGKSDIEIGLNHEEFRPQVKVVIDITGDEGVECLSIAVVPAGAQHQQTSLEVVELSSQSNGNYVPETRGLSLSGSLITIQDERPLIGKIVNLSIIGDQDIMVTRSDSSGRFFFALPGYKGSRDIFLCTEDIPGETPIIYIDNDFCPKRLSLTSPDFSLDEAEEILAHRLAVNQKVNSAYYPDTGKQESSHIGGTPFYGEPSQTLVLDDYIELPTLEEYFNELPIAVKVRRKEGMRRFRFFTEHAEMKIFDPLVMIDYVAVQDMEKVLAMNPREIDRVELIKVPYVKGSITYGGIVSFISKKHDFAGIDLPSSGTFIHYNFFDGTSPNVQQEPLPENYPDARNTLYWDPDLELDENGRATISFAAPDTPGRYVIVLREMITGLEVRKDFTVSK